MTAAPQPWKTISLGTHKTKRDLRQAVLDEGHRLSKWAERVIENQEFTISTVETTIELYAETVSGLGFLEGASVRDIYAKLDELGYGKCPDETAQQLRLQYTDQPIGEWRLVVSEPRTLSFSSVFIQGVSYQNNPSGSWVNDSRADPDYFWYGYFPLVLCRK